MDHIVRRPAPYMFELCKRNGTKCQLFLWNIVRSLNYRTSRHPMNIASMLQMSYWVVGNRFWNCGLDLFVYTTGCSRQPCIVQKSKEFLVENFLTQPSKQDNGRMAFLDWLQGHYEAVWEYGTKPSEPKWIDSPLTNLNQTLQAKTLNCHFALFCSLCKIFYTKAFLFFYPWRFSPLRKKIKAHTMVLPFLTMTSFTESFV